MVTTARLRFSVIALCALLLMAVVYLLATRGSYVTGWAPGGAPSQVERSSGSIAELTAPGDILSGSAIDAAAVAPVGGVQAGGGAGSSAGSWSTGDLAGAALAGSVGDSVSVHEFAAGGQYGSAGFWDGSSGQPGGTGQGGTGQGGTGQGGNGQGGNGQGGGGGWSQPPDEGTTTPELPSGVLVALGLVPLLVAVAWFRRRSRVSDPD